MIKFTAILYLLLSISTLESHECSKTKHFSPKPWKWGSNTPFIKQIKKIEVPGYKYLYNPSLIRIKDKFLFLFRFDIQEDKGYLYPFVSNIGYVFLDDDLNCISQPKVLPTEHCYPGTILDYPADARIIEYRNTLYVFFFHYHKEQFPSGSVFCGKLDWTDENTLSIKSCIRLYRTPKQFFVEKNWSPVVYNDKLYVEYTMEPHEVLEVNLETGECASKFITHYQSPKNLGIIRGGTPSLSWKGQYLGVFHSFFYQKSPLSNFKWSKHYYMGVHLFEGKPPFAIQKISNLFFSLDLYQKSERVFNPETYEQTERDYNVCLFPCGLEFFNDDIYISYGKDDLYAYIVILDPQILLGSLYDVKLSRRKKRVLLH